MAGRIRTLKPEFWTSEQIMSLPTVTRLLFIGIWSFCDDAGIIKYQCRSIKALIFPCDDISVDDIKAMIQSLITVGLMEQYEVDGEWYLSCTGWDKHQRIDRPSYKHPRAPKRAKEGASSDLTDNTATTSSVQPNNTSTEQEQPVLPEQEDNKDDDVDLSEFDICSRQINAWAKIGDWSNLRSLCQKVDFNPNVHGKVKPQVTKFISYYLKKEPDKILENPVRFFQNSFPGWLTIEKDGFRKSNAKPYSKAN